jgi:hypothetical protein
MGMAVGSGVIIGIIVGSGVGIEPNTDTDGADNGVVSDWQPEINSIIMTTIIVFFIFPPSFMI